jgi:hypothetical protein
VQKRSVAREPDRGYGIEGLHDDSEILRPQLLVDEPLEAVAHAIGARTGADVKLIQKERKNARPGLLRRTLFVRHGVNWAGVSHSAGQRTELDARERPGGTVFQELEIRRPKVDDGPALRVRHDCVDSDCRDIRFVSGLSRRECRMRRAILLAFARKKPGR